jgi:hypothetical protein
MKSRKDSRFGHAAAAILAALFLLVSTAACSGGLSLQERVGEIDAAFRAGNARLSETTAFVEVLKEFDFENAAFLESTLSALDASEDAAQGLLASIDELNAVEYEGDLASLGGYVREYSTAAVDTVGELQEIYEGLRAVLLAVEPVLREEAVITQMEAPGSDAELLERLESLDAALSSSLAELPELEVPPLLVEYKSLFVDLLTTMRELVGDLITVVSGQAANINMEDNPDFLHVQELLASYQPLVEELYGNLAITGIDGLIEQVELELNRLYLLEDE